MAIIEIKDLQFSFPDSAKLIVDHVSISIEPGSLVILCGPTGCGKTTLLRHLKPELLPVGVRAGQVLFQGAEIHEATNTISPGDIGIVIQHPESQIVMEDVRQELVFGLENLGLPTEKIRARVAEVAQYFALETWIDQKIEQLSGGQKQLLNLASVLLLQPKVLLLDEPTAQLDPIAAKQFIETIRRLNQELGMTVIMCEHRLEETLPLADRILVMVDGAICFDGDPRQALQFMWQEERAQFEAYIPSAARLQYMLQNTYNDVKLSDREVSISVKDGRIWFDEFMLENKEKSVEKKDMLTNIKKYQQLNQSDKPILSFSEVIYRYQADEEFVLKRLSLDVYKNEWLALLGGNGAGKTTLLHAALGLLKPQQGRVKLDGRKLHTMKEQELYSTMGFLPQNPMAYFMCDKIKDELLLSGKRWNGTKVEQEQALSRMVEHFQLSHLLDHHPHDLSGGERQKAALACVLLGQPKLLLMDEPTKGLDPLSKQQLAVLLQGLHRDGLTILMVTHDVEFAAATASRCALLFDGEIASEGTPQQFFSQNYFYTTSINRIVRRHMPQVLIEEDVIKQWNVRFKEQSSPS